MPILSPQEIWGGKTVDCDCGKQHVIPVRQVVYHSDALEQLPSICGLCSKRKSVLILADTRTWEVGGAQAAKTLRNHHWSVSTHILGDTDHHTPRCDDRTHARLQAKLPDAPLFLAVGSGVINDLTKWIAAERNVPYIVLATAASMNGYAAANVAPLLRGVKSLVRARAPVAVLAEPEVIRSAPYRLTSAGFADLLARSLSTADWLMNHLLLNEYYCGFCRRLIDDIEQLYLSHPEKVAQQDPRAIESLFLALVYSGLAMTLVGTSAPASGGEHLLSHTLDMLACVDGHPHDLHGRQVGVGCILAAALFECLAGLDRFAAYPLPKAIDRDAWGSLADAVAEQYRQKQDKLQIMAHTLSQEGQWAKLQENLQPHWLKPGKLKNALERAGAAHRTQDIGCDPERLKYAAAHMHEIRQRTTGVDLAWLGGILPEKMDPLIETWLT